MEFVLGLLFGWIIFSPSKDLKEENYKLSRENKELRSDFDALAAVFCDKHRELSDLKGKHGK